MTNDAPDGTRLYTSRVIPPLLEMMECAAAGMLSLLQHCMLHPVITAVLHAACWHCCSPACCILSLLQHWSPACCMLNPVKTAVLHAACCMSHSLRLRSVRPAGGVTLLSRITLRHSVLSQVITFYARIPASDTQWQTASHRVTPRHTQSLSPESHWPRQNTSLGQSWSTYLLVINNPHSYLWEHTLIINVSCQIVAWARANLFWHQNV